ncbi:MAG: hypothetical protein Q8L56_03375 [Rhodocyclaceae bacterium]|nr:hypothetical protein [Rhodocyclaceae bacterium]
MPLSDFLSFRVDHFAYLGRHEFEIPRPKFRVFPVGSGHDLPAVGCPAFAHQFVFGIRNHEAIVECEFHILCDVSVPQRKVAREVIVALARASGVLPLVVAY